MDAQGEENGCKSQSKPIQTPLDNWDGHNPDNSRPIAESQDQGQSSGSMDTSHELDQYQDSSDDQHNSDNHDQYSDHNSQYPFEMIVLKSEVVVEEEQHVGIVEGGLQMKKEEMEEETFMNDKSIPTDSSNRFTIKQEHMKEVNEEDMNEVESDGECHSFSTKMQIQDISPGIDTAINVIFKAVNTSIAFNEQNLSAEGIQDQGGSTSNKCDNNSPDRLLFTDNQDVHSSNSYTCKYCDYRTNNKSNLTQHSLIHSGERPYNCEYCEKSFNQKRDLTRHLHTHTGERPYSCEFCDKSFIQKSQLTTHLFTHTGERPYSCEICEKTFAHKFSLTVHLQTHAGERPYSCEFCNKSFTRKSNLTTHLHTHTGERPYNCELCEKTFTNKSHLTRHLHTHTGERPYSCEFCEKTFTQIAHFTTHLHTHTGERPYNINFYRGL